MPRKRVVQRADEPSSIHRKPSQKNRDTEYQTQFAAIHAKLDVILAELHEFRRIINRLVLPAEVINVAEAARRLARSAKTLRLLHARRVFTDGRAPECRRAGSPLVFYADEIETYREEGERGVKRLREKLGRK